MRAPTVQRVHEGHLSPGQAARGAALLACRSAGPPRHVPDALVPPSVPAFAPHPTHVRVLGRQRAGELDAALRGRDTTFELQLSSK